MVLHTIGSGSSGNCYALEIDGFYVLLDCGVPYKDIAKALNYQMHRVVGCLLTHEHGDHVKSAAELIRRGIKVYTSFGTSKHVKGLCTILQPMIAREIGRGIHAIGFNVPHDAEEPFGYMLNVPGYGIVAFITDAMYCEFTFPGVRCLLVEANYSEELIKNDPDFLRERIMKSHMSLETCKALVKANINTLETVVLLHLSDRNSDADFFLQQIKQVSGVHTLIAENNSKTLINL